MTDLLVKLYELPPLQPLPSNAAWCVRKVLAPEISGVAHWVEGQFSRAWADEFRKAAGNWPVTAFITVAESQVTGFACYDSAALGVFGPTGVADDQRGRGLGKALLLACLHDMAARGYAYAVIGGSGPDAFYERTVGAVEIPGSEPGFYDGMVRPST
jgi:GNAT superfamily N-acetyltransferase